MFYTDDFFIQEELEKTGKLLDSYNVPGEIKYLDHYKENRRFIIKFQKGDQIGAFETFDLDRFKEVVEIDPRWTAKEIFNTPCWWSLCKSPPDTPKYTE